VRNLPSLAIGALLCGIAAGAAQAAPPADIDAYVGQAMSAFGAPAVSLAIVEDGKATLSKGYGVRRLGGVAAADTHTAFPIGSESKAFTAAALAILVDRGALSWDDRVVDRLPGFAMYDPYTTAHMTVRDLLTHRSGLGLGEGDLLVVPGTNRSRADIVHALRYLKPVTGFREKFAYDNILYIVAGALVEAVSHERWEDFVRENIFKPVGMADAGFTPNAPNGVALHARTSGPIRGAGPETVLPEPPGFDVIAPAGGVNASAADMSRWMNVLLAKGALPGGGRLFSEAQAAELWRPVVVVPPDEFKLPAAMAAMQPDLQDYALGWFVESYRGHIIVEHSGAVFGALAMLYLIPDQKVGIAVAINSEDSATRRAVAFHLLDHYLGQPQTDWISLMKQARQDMLTRARAVLSSPPTGLKSGTPAMPLAAYAGDYQDPWYGPMTISTTPDGLSIRFDRTPGMEGALEPLGGQRFRTRWHDRNIEDAYVDFRAENGAVNSVTMKPISPLADFSFDYQDLHFIPASPSVN
jgi:CubicO group peptidase (beta-lactamase class C family)